MAWTLAQLADHVDGQVVGDTECHIESVATLSNAGPRQISFLINSTYKSALKITRAAAVIVAPADVEACPVNALVVNNPHAAYARIAQLLVPPQNISPGCHPSAVIAADCHISASAQIGPHVVVESGVVIGDRVYIGPSCTLGKHSRIGDGSYLTANVTICHGVKIGERALIHPAAVIGSDGFGQAFWQGHWIKVPQLGSVVIGDDVEIGASTTIDRGAIENTVIEDGVKLDNLIQIAHNVHIGANTVIAACTGIAGSARIGKRCMIGGAVGIVGHIRVADDVTITAMSFVSQDIETPGRYSSGLSVEESMHWHRNHLRFKQLDELARRIRALEKQFHSEKKV